jgi:3-phenylpropionate/trans-cinnamate dioxygenase ferredoxin component
MTENPWLFVCNEDDIDEEDLMRFDHDGRTFAVYFTEGKHYATDGMCTHEDQHLAEGFVMGDIIECPLHQGQFHIPTGKALAEPVCVDLKTYPVKVDDGKLYINLGTSDAN